MATRYTRAGLLLVVDVVCLTLAAVLVSVAVGLASEPWCGCVVMACYLVLVCVASHVLLLRSSKEPDDGGAA